MPLGLRLGAVEDGEAGHIVDNLPGREAVEVGPSVLAAVAVNPLQIGVNIRSLGLETYYLLVNLSLLVLFQVIPIFLPWLT